MITYLENTANKNLPVLTTGIAAAENTGLFVPCRDDFAAHVRQRTVFAAHRRHSLNARVLVPEHGEGGVPGVRTAKIPASTFSKPCCVTLLRAEAGC